MCIIISETVFCCSFSDIDSTIVCPPPASKAKRAADYVESKGVLAEHYDIMMHFAIAHMRRADGALPQHSSGRKALDFLAPAGEHRCSLFTADYTCQLCVWCPGNVCRYFIRVRPNQPVYGFWFFCIWEKVVGPALEELNSALNPKTPDEVDRLLEAEIYMYVLPPRISFSTPIKCIICIMYMICVTCVICVICIIFCIWWLRPLTG